MADSVKRPTPWRSEEKLRTLYCERGLTTTEIADEWDTASSTVSRWLDRHDIETNANGSRFDADRPWTDADTLRELYHGEGLTTYEIAEKWDITAVTVQDWLGKHDIPKRDSTRRSHENRPSDDRLRELYPEKRSGELADQFGVCVRSVLNWLHEAGIDVKARGGGVGDESHNWEDGTHDYYGPKWKRQREKVLERDSHECLRCSMSESEHEDTFGSSLHVHHLQKVRKFDDMEDAHELSNLATLCIPCHRAVEDYPIDVRHLI